MTTSRQRFWLALAAIVAAVAVLSPVSAQNPFQIFFGSTPWSANSGNKDGGTARVVLATDQPQLTNKLLVTPDANSAINLAQVNGVTITTGSGATGTGVPRTNDVASGATGSAVPAAAAYIGGLASGATGGNLAGATACDSDANINISTATTTLLVTGVSARKVHICTIIVGPVAGAQTMVLIEGTGATCGTGTAAFWGGTTAASGWNMAANGGFAFGSGFGDIVTTTTTGDSVCAITSAAVATPGHIKYAIY